jgi:hypothetical protein
MTVEILLKAQVEGGAGIYLAAHTLSLKSIFFFFSYYYYYYLF